jgi:predicted dehydrogenase
MKRFNDASEIKVGVVGYGGAFNMGRHHLAEMQKAGMTPVAVCEIDPERRKAAEQDYPGIQAYANLSQMLKQSDVRLVTIITPHNTHAKLALTCLKAGRHVVVEKPMAVTTAECDAMIAEARKSGVVLSTYHNRHWDGCILEAVRRIGSGAIGEIVRIEAHMGGWGQPRDWWRSSRSISGGILYDWGVHLLEYTLQLIRSEIREVSGFAKRGYWAPRTAWKDDTNEDEAFAVVRYRSGQWSTLMISSLDSKPKEGWMEITGTEGSYVMDGPTFQVIQRRQGETVITRGNNPPSEGWRFYQNIADHLVKGDPLVITPEWARRPIHILDLACRSASQGHALLAKYS